MKEPSRLRDSDQVPRALRDALRSLERQAPRPEAVVRVQRVLEGLPAGSAGPAQQAGSPLAAQGAEAAAVGGARVVAGVGVGKLSVLAALVALATGVTIAANRGQETSLRAGPRTEAEAHSAHAPASRVDAERTREPAVEAREQGEARTSRPTAGDQGGGASPLQRAEERPTERAKGRPGRAVETPPVDRRSPDRPAERAPVSTEPSRLAAEAQAGLVDADRAAAPPAADPHGASTARSSLAPPSDEASLLYRAKLLAADAPAAALALLETHALRFPGSAFVQEREVLAIRLHAKLGHAAEAERLRARFRARFPDSMYRNAIAP